MTTTTPITDRAERIDLVETVAAASFNAVPGERWHETDEQTRDRVRLAVRTELDAAKVHAPPPPTLEERFARSAITVVRDSLGVFISFNGPHSASVNVPWALAEDDNVRGVMLRIESSGGKGFPATTEAAVFANLGECFEMYGDARVAKARATWDREAREAEEVRSAARPADPAGEDDAKETAEQLARKIVCSRGKQLYFAPHQAGVVSWGDSPYTMVSDEVASCAAEDARAVFAAAIRQALASLYEIESDEKDIALAQQAQAHADDKARAVEAAVRCAAEEAYAYLLAQGKYHTAQRLRDAILARETERQAKLVEAAK